MRISVYNFLGQIMWFHCIPKRDTGHSAEDLCQWASFANQEICRRARHRQRLRRTGDLRQWGHVSQIRRFATGRT